MIAIPVNQLVGTQNAHLLQSRETLYLKRKNFGDRDGEGLFVSCELFDAHYLQCLRIVNLWFPANFYKNDVHKILYESCMSVDVYKFCSVEVKKWFTNKLVNFFIFNHVKDMNASSYDGDLFQSASKKQKLLHK